MTSEEQIIIRKCITGYAYARNGNAHNPTPRVRWYAYRGAQCIDRAATLRALKAEYPGAKVERLAAARGV